MQILTNRSKYLILSLLSCGLMMAWLGANRNVSSWDLSEEDAITVNATRNGNVTPEIITLQIANRFRVAPLAASQDEVTKKMIDAISNKTMASFTPRMETVWQSLSKELKMDHRVQSAQVQAEIRKLIADQKKLTQILTAATPYIYYIHQQTRAKKLPAELALIPFIESEFNPNDRSNKGATGIWQFMSGTARELGLQIKAGYDGRRDIVASTKAALAYFNDLGQLFKGNWYLAIAAYNCGQGKVAATVKRANSKDFWKLSLPQETKYYVPRLLAVAAIVKNPEKYGIKLPIVKNEPYFTEVKIKKSVNLESFAKTTGINVKELHSLNPDYNKGLVLKKGSYSLLIPVKNIINVRAKLLEKANLIA